MTMFKRVLLCITVAAVGAFLFSDIATAQTAQRKFLIDLGAETITTSGGWNNLTRGTTGTQLSNLIDSTGASSALKLEVTDSFWQGWVGAYNGNGSTQSGIYPSSATSDSFFVGNHLGTLDDVARVRFSGLTPGATYTLKAYGSRMSDDQTSDRTTVFAIGGQSKELQTRNNVSNLVEFQNLSSTNNTLELTVTVKSGAIYGYVGVLELIENGSTSSPTPGGPTVAVTTTTPTITLPTNSVLLQSTSSGSIKTGLWSQISGPNQATIATPTTAYAEVRNLIAGTYVFRMTVTDYSNLSNYSDVTVTVNPAGTLPPPPPPPPEGQGLNYKYYSLTTAPGITPPVMPNLDTLAPTKTGTVAKVDISPRLTEDSFAFHYDGSLTIPTAGQYTFYLQSDDGSKLWIDNTLVLDHDGAHWYWEKASAPVTLAAGTHTIKVDYYEGYGNEYLALSWQGPGLGKQEIPSSAFTAGSTPPPTNSAPVVNAGTDQIITLPTSSVSLTGSATDANGDAMTYSWAKVSGGAATIGAATVLTTPISGLTQGSYTFRLTATDSKGAASSDDVQVMVNAATTPPPTQGLSYKYYQFNSQLNVLPNFDTLTPAASGAISTFNISPRSTNDRFGFRYDGTLIVPTAGQYTFYLQSDDGSKLWIDNTLVLDHDGAHYAWEKAGLPVTLAAGNHTIRVEFFEETGSESLLVSWQGPGIAKQEISASALGAPGTTPPPPPPTNSAPVVNAGTDQTVTLPTSSATLTGSATDANGDAMIYSWTKISGGSATIATANALSTGISGLTQGSYTFRLTATDSKGAASSDDVQVTVNASSGIGLPPIVNAGPDLTIPEQSNTVKLTQTATDPEGKSVTVNWTQLSGPNQATIYSQPWNLAIAYNLIKGSYTFRLTATDADGQVATDDVKVNVNSSTGSGSPFMRTVTQKSVVAGGKTIYYYESLPKGYNTDTNRTWPLIVFSHGIGERGSTLASLPAVLSSMPIDNNLEFNNDSFIVMMPQLHESYGNWQDFFTQAMIDTAKAGLRVDTSRVYLVGYSLGGFQTWSFPQQSDANAAQIAAIAPVSGGSSSSTICKIATNKIGVWAFHATDDGTVNVSTTDGAINALNNCNPAPSPTPKYTRYTSGNHWILGFATDPNAPSVSNLFQWLLTQKKGVTAPTNTAPTVSAGTDQTVTLPTSSVSLTGSATDANGDAMTYSWAKISGGSATISSANAVSTSISGLAQGSYTFRLTATDSKGAASSDDVQITVNPPLTGLSPASRTLTARTTTVPQFNETQGYYESLPRGYNNDTTKKWPALVFLHGIGERGNGTTDLPRVLANGTPYEIAQGQQLEFTVNGKTESFVVIIPQLPAGASEWHPYQVDRAIEIAKSNYRVDPKRIYLAGLSLGGFGTWRYPEVSLEFANKVAAIAPSDGGNTGNGIYTPGYPGEILPLSQCHISNSHLPIWAFYGLNDTSWGWTVTGALSQLAQCSPAANPAPIVTGYAGVGHGAWGRAYSTGYTYHNPNVYEWLLTKSR